MHRKHVGAVQRSKWSGREYEKGQFEVVDEASSKYEAITERTKSTF